MLSLATDETNEYFIPIFGLEVEEYLRREDIQGIHHLCRYHWAKAVLEQLGPRAVLDMACGAGYGSYILAKHLTNTVVLGCDYDQRAVRLASSRYSSPNLSFAVGNMVTWERAGAGADLGIFDAIVSFDTIKRLLHRDIALLRIRDHLTPHGCLLLSTPCGHEKTQLNPDWAHPLYSTKH